ncbi:Zinc finger, PHD-type [Sesbania bispinosa]|nr:Zinc finger, PHD-type [Sesbania bispinosa]
MEMRQVDRDGNGRGRRPDRERAEQAIATTVFLDAVIACRTCRGEGAVSREGSGRLRRKERLREEKGSRRRGILSPIVLCCFLVELGFWGAHDYEMIIKRNMKAEMLNVKRCKLEEDEDYEYSAIQKKQRVNGFGSVADGYSGSGSSEGSNCGGEVHFNSNSMELNGADIKAPPLLRSSRGRVQMLPARFSDSVLDTWKWKNNGRIKIEDKRSGYEVDDNSLRDIGLGFEKQGKRKKCGSKNSHCFPDSAEIEMGGLGFNDFDYEKHANSFKSIKTTVNGGRSLLVKTESNGIDENAKRRKDIYKLEDFALGDIVWAKCGKQYPAWPAVVIDPILQAPKSVLNCCVPGAICVMFFGYSKNGKQRDYAWAKQGMIFPFLEFMGRFQGQTRLYKSKLSDFHMAMEEAMLAEDGILDTHLGAEQIMDGAAGSCVDQEYSYQNQDTISCAGCGLMLPCKTKKKIKDSSCAPQHYCKPCAKLLKSKQYCGICKKIWHHSDGGNWVCCDGCNVWVHAECDKISNKLFKDLENIDYYCPDCKGKFTGAKLQSTKSAMGQRMFKILLPGFVESVKLLMLKESVASVQ